MAVNELLPEDVSPRGRRENRNLAIDDAAGVLEALSCETSRAVLEALAERPRTISDVAAELDMSIQRVSYHVDRLESLDIIRVVGTKYSEKAKRMDVYESAVGSIRIQLDDPDHGSEGSATPAVGRAGAGSEPAGPVRQPTDD